MYGAFRVAGRESIFKWEYVHISWRKEILKRVSLFVIYSWKRLYVSYKMEWLSWHSWIILSRAEEYVWSKFSNTRCCLVDSSLISFLLKLLQRWLTPIIQGKLESPLIKVTLLMTFLSRQSSCVVIVPSQLANHAWLRIIVPTYWVSTLGLSTQLQNQFLP